VNMAPDFFSPKASIPIAERVEGDAPPGLPQFVQGQAHTRDGEDTADGHQAPEKSHGPGFPSGDRDLHSDALPGVHYTHAFNCTSSYGPEKANNGIKPIPDTATRGPDACRPPRSQIGRKRASS
jgi:hypothetical protein